MGTRLFAPVLTYRATIRRSGILSHPEIVRTSPSRCRGRCRCRRDQHLRRQPLLAGAIRPARCRRLDQSPCVELAAHAAGPDRFVLGGWDRPPPTKPAPRPNRPPSWRGRRRRPPVRDLSLNRHRAGARGSHAGRRLGLPLIVSLWDWPDPPGPTARRLVGARSFWRRHQLPAGGPRGDPVCREHAPRPRLSAPGQTQRGSRRGPRADPGRAGRRGSPAPGAKRALDRRLLRDHRGARRRRGRGLPS